MNLNDSKFAYNATIKLSEIGKCDAFAAFPGVNDIAVNSRNFGSYMECVTSCKSMMDDFVNGVNKANSRQFVVSSEVNPQHSGQSTRSKDWSEDEVARLWIFDKSQENAVSIHAVGQARIFLMGKLDPARLN